MKTGSLFGKDLTWSVGLFTAGQMFLIQCEFLYWISWMLSHKLNRKIRVLCSVFFVFFPLIPLYAISVWKDTPFCMAFLFWMMFVVDIYFEIKNGSIHIKTFMGFLAGMILVAFTRNNGIYVVALSVLCLFPLFGTKVWKKKTYLKIAGGYLTLAIICLIQGPVYNWTGIEQTAVAENFGIPLQQIGAAVAYDGVITEEQKSTINNFIPYENIKEHYSPMLADNLKWYAGLNEQYLLDHTSEFLQLWAALLRQNPFIYVKAYLMETLGFWNVDVSGDVAYVQTFIWNDNYGIVQTDYFLNWFGFSFQHFVTPRHFISCAWFFWFFFIAAWFCMKHYSWKTVFLFLPQLGVWATLMIATPVAISLRYIASNMFTLPFVIITPMLLERKEWK